MSDISMLFSIRGLESIGEWSWKFESDKSVIAVCVLLGVASGLVVLDLKKL